MFFALLLKAAIHVADAVPTTMKIIKILIKQHVAL
jgi:hypothetical protein